jgi:hypothetical protein
MLKKPIQLILVIFLISLASAYAQGAKDPKDNKSDDSDKNKAEEVTGNARLWQTKLPGGHYLVALDHIASISRHKYLLDGAVVIDEVTVDSNGQALARFYVISPITDESSSDTLKHVTSRATELLEKASDRGGVDTSTMVVKKYPETTHAKCIEYRLTEEKELTALFTSLRTAWETGRGRIFTAK